MPNKFFPVSIDLNNKNILVIGAGKIALRKVKTLLDYNCNITVITKEVSEEEFLELEKENKIKILKNQEFEEKFLEDTFLVVSATDNKELNDKISKLCITIILILSIIITYGSGIIVRAAESDLTLTPKPETNNIHLKWTGPQNSSYKVYQKKPGASSFETIGLTDFSNVDEEVKVIPKSALLKVWMEGRNSKRGRNCN